MIKEYQKPALKATTKLIIFSIDKLDNFMIILVNVKIFKVSV